MNWPLRRRFRMMYMQRKEDLRWVPLRAPCLPWDMTDQRETLEAAERYELACLPRGAAVKIMMNSHQEAEVKSLTQGKRQNLSETRNSQERGKPRRGQLSSGHSPSVTRFLSCVECWQDGQWADETKDLSQRLTRNLKGHTRAQLRPKPSIHTQRKATAISPSSPESLSGN